MKLLKRVFYIYSKQLKKKKLYYFMKICMITSFLKNKYNKSNINLTFNRLYNDYISLNTKKDNMKINYIRNESKLYPFSPSFDNRNFATFSPEIIKKYSQPSLNTNFDKKFYFTEKMPLNKKYRNIFNKNGRNDIRENEYFSCNNYSENDKRNDIYYKFCKNKTNPINLKQSSYKCPYQRNINSSRINHNINKQLMEYIKGNRNNYYLKNFNKNKKQFVTLNKEGKIDNLFKKSNRKEIVSKNEDDLLSFIYKRNSNSPVKFKNNYNKNKIQNRNKGNNMNKKIYNDSQIYSKNKKDTYSNKSLYPSSAGIDQTKTYYTTNNIKSNNALMSNINSSSLPNTHYLIGLKISSGFNECFYDINKENKINNNKNELSMQSLSDSKMFELATKYVTEDENSSEIFYMNNIIHNKKKYRNRK